MLTDPQVKGWTAGGCSQGSRIRGQPEEPAAGHSRVHWWHCMFKAFFCIAFIMYFIYVLFEIFNQI